MSATFILDGSNLAWLGPGEGASLAPVDAIADALRAEWPGCKVIALCDASLRHRLSPADKAEHERRTKAGELVEAPADEDADAYILESARRLGGCVVTRDLYRDRREARAGVPMLRPALIGGAVILGDPKVFPTADSDRGEPLPADALGPRVAPAPLPGGEPVDAASVDPSEADAAADASAEKQAAGSDAEPEAKTDGDTGAESGDDPQDKSEAEPPEKPARRRKQPSSKTASSDKKPTRARGAKTRTRKTKSSGSKSSGSKGGRRPSPEPTPSSRPLIVLALVVAAGALVGLARWMVVDDVPALSADDGGVLFARNCKGWLLAGQDERIVFHARSDQCATSIAALGPERYLVTVADGDAPETVGAVSLIVVEDGVEGEPAELTRGRAGAGDVPDERATARITGVDAAAGVVALTVWPSAERPPLSVVRRIDGDVLAHDAALAGLTLASGRAAALKHHCPAGCGSAHIADDPHTALDAARSAPAPAEAALRWAGPAAFSPDGTRLAAAEAFDNGRGGVVLIDVASGEQRRLAFEARDQTRVTGLAWTAAGIFLGASGALYQTGPDGDGVWLPVSRNPESLAPARP